MNHSYKKTELKEVLAVGAAIIALGLLSSCAEIKSSDLNQADVATHYTGTYDETSHAVTANANFTAGEGIGATQVELDGDSQVSFNNREMPEVKDIIGQINYISGVNYVSNTGLSRHYVFDYVDDGGIVYENQFFFPQPSEVSVPEQNVSRDGFDVYWSVPDSVTPSETLYVIIESSTGESATAYPEAGDTGHSGLVHIPSETLNSFSNSQLTLQTCRSRSSDDIEAPSIGGNLTVQSCGLKIDVELVRGTVPASLARN